MAEVVFRYSPPAEVTLVAVTGDEQDLATVTRGYSGRYDLQMEPEELEGFLQDLQHTKLKTPNAFVNMVWLLRNVTRNFEQQLTRYRVGTAFVCESLRFSEKRHAEFYCKMKTIAGRQAYCDTCEETIRLYEYMLERGEAVQDARDILPSGICTHMFASINLQTLSHIYSQRACCQAQQEEWSVVLRQMREALQKQYPGFASFLQAPWQNKYCVDCQFNASFDRPCSNQHLFDANLRALAAERLSLFDGVQQVEVKEL